MPSRLRSLGTPVLLGVICFLVYNANLRQIGAGDTLPARYLPLGIWHYGTLYLDRIERWVAHGHPTIAPWERPASNSPIAYQEPWAYWIARTSDHHLVSFYPVVAPLLVAPLYLPVVAYLNYRGWEQPRIDWLAQLMEKLSASLIATITSILVYLLLRREGNRWSLGLALAFAFGTNTWMISSQALWQHGAGQLLIAIALLLSTSSSTPIRSTALGAVCVAIAANRPPDAFIAGAFLFHAVWTRWRSAWWLVAGAALPLAALLIYNVGMIGSLTGGYGTTMIKRADFFRYSVWSGLAGLLVSPARGLLVFTPYLVFVPVGLMQRLRDPNKPNLRALVVALGVGIVAQLLLYAPADWRAGTSWGPRWLTDVLPILVWMLAPAALILRPFARVALIMTILGSIGVQAIGAFWYTKTSDDSIFTNHDASLSRAWNMWNVPFAAELRHSYAPGEVLCKVTGTIDRIGNVEEPPLRNTIPILKPGTVIEGQVLACARSPRQIFLLIDGVAIGKFLSRPTADTAMHKKGFSDWRVSANLRGVQPGERVLQLAVRIARSETRIVREQRVTVTHSGSSNELVSPALDAMADRAASGLRERQNMQGYWRTSYTSKPSFENPQPEMNTYLTSTLVDLLSPIANQYLLEDVIDRARSHLRAQIESNGLVRYHGLPDGPAIGKLGCVITPDADDTSLVWRIAGPGANDPRQERMLQTLSQYRDERGLYRTWLAPRDRYECVDPGRDPNPADATIQMHIYMMLRELDPAAAASLCGALKRNIGDQDLWVYYDKAPLMPSLRSAQLQQLDCAVPLPPNRLGQSVPGQEIWSEAARRVVEITTSPPNADDRKSIIDLLARLGNNDFAELRRMPPLLYHNDLTATVPRYYWSEDIGYALWLRLYDGARTHAGISPWKP